uniref:Uncharacterized protein n=1 Tax=Desertifilum tharense IPPAS B-1220 TaxID=1781255 RepID=A0ACD5GSQ7_9CYAN
MGGKRGVGSWGLGVGEEGNWELGVGGWGRTGIRSWELGVGGRTGIRSWELGVGGRTGIRSWELGVGGRTGIRSWELGVGEEEKIGRLDNCQLSTLFHSELGTLHSFPHLPIPPSPHPLPHSALSTLHSALLSPTLFPTRESLFWA